MKKRKSPIMLISFLVILVGVVGFVNQFMASSANPEIEQHAEATAQESNPADEILVSAAGKALVGNQEAMVTKKKGPSILKNKSKGYVPKKIPSNIQGQWYNEAAAK